MENKKVKWGKDLIMPGLTNKFGLIERLTDYEVPDELVFFTIDEVSAILRITPRITKLNINSGNIETTRLFKKSKGKDRISLKELKRIVNEGIDFRAKIGTERDKVQKEQIKNLRLISQTRKRKIDQQRKRIETLEIQGGHSELD